MKGNFVKRCSTIGILSCLLVFISCSSNDRIEIDSFYWNQTMCSDPWGTNGSDSNSATTSAIAFYLMERGISNIKVVSYENTLPDNVSTCTACHCPNGIVIQVDVGKGQIKKMEKIGFFQKQ